MGRIITRVLDAQKNVIAYEPDEVTSSLTLSINAATELQVDVPNRGPVRVPGEFLQRVHVTADGLETILATARVRSRNVIGRTIRYGARLDAALLEGNITPANYGPAFEGVLLDDFVRQVLAPWRITRADFTTAVSSSSVDIVTEPGRVILQKNASTLRYAASGNIVVRFDREDIPDWDAWDRIRWEADYFDDVSVTMQWRSSDTAGGGTWSGEIRGADPAGLGVAIQGVAHRYVDVRLNLRTDDTTTPEEVPPGQAVSVRGFTPRVFGVEVISRAAPVVTEGSITVTPGTTVKGVTADRANSLSLLASVLPEYGHEFTVRDGVIHVADALGTNRADDVLLVDGRNVTIRSLEDTDAQLVNRLHAYGIGTGLQQPYALVEDAQSIALYGVYEDVAQFEESTVVGLESAAGVLLSRRAHPEPRFAIDAPASLLIDAGVELGDRVSVVNPASESIVAARVTGIRYQSGVRGERAELNVGTPSIGILSILRGEADKSRLELLPPVVRARPTAPGFEVLVGHAPNSRGVSFEVHYSTVSGFTPDAGTLRGEGAQTVFPFPRATPGVKYYVRVASVDRQGNRSMFAPVAIVTGGRVQTAQIGPGAVTDTELADNSVKNPKLDTSALGSGTRTQASGVSVMQGTTEVMKLGNIANKSGVPSGVTHGLWGALGTGVFIQGAPRVLAAGRIYNNASAGSVPGNGQPHLTTWPEIEIHGSINIPAGKTVIAVTSWAELSAWNSSVPQARRENIVIAGWRASLFGYRSSGGGNGPSLTGAYNRIVLRRETVLMNLSSSASVTFVRSSLNYLLVEVDVPVTD